MSTATPVKRSVVIVGGASGIGLGAARAFQAMGDDVVIADRDGDAAQRVAAELDVTAREVDVTDESSVAALFGGVRQPDCVVNTAGINLLGPVTAQSAEDWRAVLDVCLTGSFLVIKHAAAVMDRGGSIVTISSLNGKQAAVGMAAYCSAKAGLEMLTQVAALELGPRGIRVNAVAPGLVDTPLVAPLFALDGIESEFLDNTPLGRSGTTDDIAAAVTFLSSPGSWITGETLAVDGGARMRRYPGVFQAISAHLGQGTPQ